MAAFALFGFVAKQGDLALISHWHRFQKNQRSLVLLNSHHVLLFKVKPSPEGLSMNLLYDLLKRSFVLLSLFSTGNLNATNLKSLLERHVETHGKGHDRAIKVTIQYLLKHAGQVHTDDGFSLEKIRKDADHYVFIRSKGPNWGSRAFKLNQSTDVAGNPLYVFMHLSPKIARFLEFRITKHKGFSALEVPTASRLNTRLKLLNNILKKQGKEGVPIQYYRQKAANRNSVAFVNKFIDEGKLPIAEEETIHHVHDLSFHLHSILLSKIQLDTIRHRTRDLRAYGERLDDPRHRQLMYKLIASYIDQALGRNYTFFQSALIPKDRWNNSDSDNTNRLMKTGIFFSGNIELDYTLSGFKEFCRVNVVPSMFGGAHQFAEQDYAMMKTILDGMPSPMFGFNEQQSGLQVVENMLNRRSELTGAISLLPKLE